MSDLAISCHDLGKRYSVGASGGGSDAEDFWALRGVSFEITEGQVVGIVGRNGAGKSTLLKILCRITQPTEGRIVINGRVAGLLEVGTGFHPELTGRENIFLNGTLLGMTRKEVGRNFDAIVDFAGVEYFLETPVKRYSSGMYVRLAFAVAAHLSNEILILDEVLAVGDAAFQRKCLGKMHELASNEGRTVLLVSHNAEVIRQHAERALRLDKGHLVLDSTVQEVLEAYESHDALVTANVEGAVRVDANWGQVARITEVAIVGDGTVVMGEPLVYEISVDVRRPLDLGVGQTITTLDDRPIGTSFSALRELPVGRVRLRVTAPTEMMAPGKYGINIVVGRSSFAVPDLHYDGVLHPVVFEVIAPDVDPIVDWHPEWWGFVALEEPEVEVV